MHKKHDKDVPNQTTVKAIQEVDKAVSDYIKKQKLKKGEETIEPFLTVSIQKDIETDWYVGQIEEFPGAI